MWQLFSMDRDNEDSFSSCGPSRKSGGHKALPRNFEYFLLWLDVIWLVQVEWMCSHMLEIKIQTWARPWLSAFQRQPGSGARQACRLIIPAQCHERSDGVDTYHVCVMLKIWRKCAHAQQTAKQTTKYRNLNVGCGVPCWLSGIRVHLPMQETQVWSLVWEDPTCGATKPVHHDYWACALEPGSCNCWAHGLQLLKPTGCSCWSLPTRACTP